MKEKVVYHLHDDTSNCNGYADSCTNFKDYIKLAKRDGDKAIAFSNHGGIYDWVKKKQECDKKGIKYIHGIETYMCEKLEDNDRGYHLGLYARNWDGVLELNSMISKSFEKGTLDDNSDRHVYYNPRMSMDEVMNTSDNIIVTTACLQSILWKYTQRYNKLKNISKDTEFDSVDMDKINKGKISTLSETQLESYNKLKGKAKQNFLSEIEFDCSVLAQPYLDTRNKFLKWIVDNKHRVFMEVQPHTLDDQIEYNKLILKWCNHYGLNLIAGTDTHSSTAYKAECRKILQVSKDSFYGDEDKCDLSWKTYEELFESFKKQNVLSEEEIQTAIGNTVVFADMCEDFSLNRDFKYPNLYKDSKQELRDLVEKKFEFKKRNKWLDMNSLDEYRKRIEEELFAFEKQDMNSFILFMAELLIWCEENGIPHGDRGSFGGSTVGYITDMTDIDPVVWKTVFSRFCNISRVSLADIDIDFAPEDRARVYEYIINRFTPEKTSYILTFGTLKNRGTIDVLSKGLNPENNDLEKVKKIKNEFDRLHEGYKHIINNEIDLEELSPDDDDAKNIDFDFHDIYIRYLSNPNSIEKMNEIKNDWDSLKKSESELFYYFDGIKDTIVSKGQHPAGIIGSPISLVDNLGVHYKDGDRSMPISSCSMKAVDSLNYVKFDILGLKTIGIIKDAEKYAGIKHPKSHELNWSDEKVWANMIESPIGVFQFEGKFAFELLKKFVPSTITHMSMINAGLRPSGKSYRDRLVNREFNKNPSQEIDELFKDNNGFLIFQEDTIKFLTDICGFEGGTADEIRRCIGKKDHDTLLTYLPKIMDGYVNYSKKPKDVAEKEVKEFLQIIEDSSDYQFGFNHSTGYSQNGYRCAYLRTYHPLAFATSYMGRAQNAKQKLDGIELAKMYKFTLNPIKFRYSTSEYNIDPENNAIYKGVKSVKGLGKSAGDELYKLRFNKYESFTDLILDIITHTSVNKSKILTLAKLGFFNEFYGRNKICKIVETFFENDIYKKSTASKTSLIFDEELIKKHSKKSTDKQYSGVDYVSVIKEIESTIPDTEDSIKSIIDDEIEYLGSVEIIHGTDKRRTVITAIKQTEYNSVLDLYCLATGETKKFKLRKKNYRQEFKVGDILYIKNHEESHKLTPQRDENGEIIRGKNGKPIGYDKLDETELVLVYYNIEEA